MTEKKAVLNVTVAESVASAARREAASRDTTISSVVEEALAAHIEDFRRRAEGLAAIDEYYREHGYPTPEEAAEAEAAVAQEERILDEARATMAGQRASEAGSGSAA